jgi:hypothetical protein
MIERLKECFKEDFTDWLLKSNCPEVGPFKREWELPPSIHLQCESSIMRRTFDKIQSKSLQDIFDILQREPLSDYFWYGYPEHGGRLTYSLPSPESQPVLSDALRVDKEKIKIFLRDIKIESILN